MFKDIQQIIKSKQKAHGDFFSCGNIDIQVYSPNNICDLTFIISQQQEPFAKLIFNVNDTVSVYLKDPSKAHSIDYKGFTFSVDEPVSQVMMERIAKDYPAAPAVYKALSSILQERD